MELSVLVQRGTNLGWDQQIPKVKDLLIKVSLLAQAYLFHLTQQFPPNAAQIHYRL
jgi:hypothetical protein